MECSNCHARIGFITHRLTGGRCIRCARRWRHFADRPGAAAQPERWSEASRRSRAYEPGVPTYYFDEYYWCARCGQACVFTADQQQHAYEVEQRHIRSTRTLCDECHAARRAPG